MSVELLCPGVFGMKISFYVLTDVIRNSEKLCTNKLTTHHVAI